MSEPLSREQEWQKLYDDLSGLLRRYGKESAVGRGDYWLVDDDWGERQQKVCVNKIEILTAELVTKIQEVVAKSYPTWSVILALDLSRDGSVVPGGALIVRSKHIEEHFDSDALKRIFGDAFAWRRDAI
jgi:hypothetical protein